ncbi:MAG: ABC transporter ATP-binding protein [Anaerolineae bacterium]
MASPIIQMDKVTRDFKTVRALDQLSLTIEQGTIFGFLGPNGAGKTTTIRLLLGLLEPTSGSAQVLGFDTRTHANQIREKTGALLEHTGLYERLTADDNLEFYGRSWHLAAGERAARIQELLTHLQLWERRRETVSTWSRGMKQKLAVARALLHRPPLIFLDEPTAGLDPVAAAALRDDLAALTSREGVTVFLTTHNLAEAEKLCSQVAVIRAGKLLSVGHPSQLRMGENKLLIIGSGFNEQVLAVLRSRPEVTSAQLEDDGLALTLRERAEAAPLVSLLVTNGVAVEEVRKQQASLEEAFLSLVEETP